MNLNKFFLCVFVLCVSCNNRVDVKNNRGDIVVKSSKFDYYGERLSPQTVLYYRDLIDKSSEFQNKTIKVIGDIKSTCAKKGCWVRVLLSDTIELFVKFKDYSFFVPKSGVEGKKIVVEGVFNIDTTSVQELRHYAEDAGESYEDIQSIVNPKIEYTMIANGVMIR